MNTYDILGIKRPALGKRPKVLIGGDSNDAVDINGKRDETDKWINNSDVVEKYKPIKTCRRMSIFEYSETHTLFAEYIDSLKSVKSFVEELEIRSTINPVEIAFYALLENKWDANLDRGYELVSYSCLKYNPQWRDEVSNYFNDQHETQKEELFKPLQLI